MSPADWIAMQEQLWNMFGPLVSWWLAFVMAGEIGVIAILFGSIYFSEWLNERGGLR